MPDNFEQYADEIAGGLTPFADFAPFQDVIRPRFPTEKLPGALGAMVGCLADSTQTPEEMAGILSLGVLAALYQARFSVEITPDWREPLCLYCAAVASPGERKSAVISALTKPIYEFEAEQREFDAGEIEQNRTERAILEGKLQAAKHAAAKEAGKKQIALDLAAELAEFKDLHERRWLADDTTPEKLVEMMERQNGSLTVCSAEGGIFDAMQGRYDKTSGFDIYLKAHAGDPVIVDRIGRRSNYIQSPRLTMMLTIQPEVLAGLMSNTTFRGRGLCGRFLFAMCGSRIGERKISPPLIPADVKEDYRSFVRRALAGREKGTIRLSSEADELRRSYQEYVEKLLGDRWEYMRDWGGKLVGAMVRIAALMHCARTAGNPAETEISFDTMQVALDIAEFLGAHAEIAYQAMGADDETADAKYLWRKIGDADEISRRDLFCLCQGHFRTIGRMEPAIQVLVSRGYVAAIEKNTGGRPTTILRVNPLAKAAKGAKA